MAKNPGVRRNPSRREMAPPASQDRGGHNIQQPSVRCKATHDVPYTLRFVLDAQHINTGPRLVNGTWIAYVRPTAHQDKNGAEW